MADHLDVDPSLVPAILSYYAAGLERDRLFEGRSQLERVRTQELLARHLPPPPAVILDVGGGPGVYARWLASQGYEVHLVDPVPLHVEQAVSDTELGSQPLARLTPRRQPNADRRRTNALPMRSGGAVRGGRRLARQ